jgi:hypothetical protein
LKANITSNFWAQQQETAKSSQQTEFTLLPDSAGFWFSLLFHPEDGVNMLLQSIFLFPNHIALQPRILYSSLLNVYCSEVFKKTKLQQNKENVSSA